LIDLRSMEDSRVILAPHSMPSRRWSLQSPEAYGFGAGEPAGLGDEGVCDASPNPYVDGLVESICLWRNGTLVLIVGGPMAMTDIRAVAASMDTRADRLAGDPA
jgi:hypothetical protein